MCTLDKNDGEKLAITIEERGKNDYITVFYGGKIAIFHVDKTAKNNTSYGNLIYF